MAASDATPRHAARSRPLTRALRTYCQPARAHRLRGRSRRAAEARGLDDPSNMQWLTVEDAKAKDQME